MPDIRESNAIVKCFRINVNGKTFDFNHSGQCEQVLRGFVHEGYEVIIKEVSEERYVTEAEIYKMDMEGINFQRIYREGNRVQDCCVSTQPENSR